MPDRHELRPIFLVGCPRSGTTLLRLMVDSHPNISCGPETHVLGNLEEMFDRWPALRLFGFEREWWYDHMAAFVDEFQAAHAAERGKQRWADKTPRYALHLPFVETLFPNAQVVHLIRNGRDVVASHRDTWSYKSALGAPDKWARYVSAARAWGSQAGRDRYHELRYEDLVADPEPVMRNLVEFLGEPWDDVVLRYDEAEHDNYRFFDIGTDKRREADGDDRLIYASRVGRGADLDPVLERIFRVRAGRLAAELGYGGG